MKQLMMLAALMISSFSFSQNPDKDIKSIEKDIKAVNDSFASMDKVAARLDSLNGEIKKSIDRQKARIDSAEIAQMAEHSANTWAQMSRDRRAEQKKKMWIYFGMAGLGIIVLIVGLRRKSKK